MARISSYDQDSSLNVADKLLGTDSATGATKNFTLDSVLGLVNDGGLVQAFDGSTFQFTDYVAPGSTPQGILNLNEGTATTTAFSAINQIFISVKDTSGLSLAEYLDNTANDFIKISKKDNLNNFGIFEVTAIQTTGSGEYRKLTVTPRGTNGNLTAGVKYFVANYSALYDQDFSDDAITEFGDVANTFFTGSTASQLTAAGSGSIITTAERTSLTNFTNNGLIHGDVVNNLTTNTTDVPLSANQGVVLKGLIDGINQVLQSNDADLDIIQEIVDYVKTNRSTLEALGISTIPGLQAALNAKEDSVTGKGLSANDFTDALLTKLNGIAANAEVNVQADFNAVSGDALILNKPTDLTVLSGHNVTELADVTSAGSGAIISSTERDLITSTHATFIGFSSAERAKLAGIDVNTSTRVVTDGTDSITIPTNTNTTYDLSVHDSGDDAIIRLSGSDSTTDNVTLEAGNNITLTPNSSTLTIAASLTTAAVADGSTSLVTGDHVFDYANPKFARKDQAEVFADNVTITGNLIVSGTTTTINTANLTIEDNIMILNSGQTGTPAASLRSGIEIERGDATNVKLQFNENTDKWEFTNDGSTFYQFPITIGDLASAKLELDHDLIIDSKIVTKHSDTVKTMVVTVVTKTTAHPAYDSSAPSALGYSIDGIESPELTFAVGNTYRFDVSDSSNGSHPLRFYNDESRSNIYSTGVTINGTQGQSGAYVQIIPTESTPTVLYYQCSAHANMGWKSVFNTRNLTGFNTDNLTEGSSNLYFTNARADGRIAAASINALSDVDISTSAPSTGQALVWDGSKFEPGAVGSTLTVKDGTTVLSTAATTLKFTGNGVTASGTGAEKTITIPGGTSGITVQEEGSDLSTAATTLNFTGSAVTASGTGAVKTINITGGGSSGGTVTIEKNVYTGDGSDLTFDTSTAIANENNVQVYIDGVYQSKNNYTTSGSTVTFGTGNAPPNGTSVELIHMVSTSGVIARDSFTGDGSTTAFVLSMSISNENATQVYLDGVYQSKNNYITSGSTLTFTPTAPPNGTAIEVVHIKAVAASSLNQNNFTGNGSTTAFTLSQSIDDEAKTFVFIQGVYQEKSTYDISGTTLTFNTAPQNGYTVEVMAFSTISVGNNVIQATNWQSAIKTSNFTAEKGKGYFVNTSGGAVTVTLPSSPLLGDIVEVSDYGNSSATNNITFTSSNNIQGGSEDKILAKDNGSVKLVYSDSTKGWVTAGDSTDGLSGAPFNIDYLIIAGGGGGGGTQNGGGGGAGGYRNSYASEYSGGNQASEASLTVALGTNYSVEVGNGGAGGSANTAGTNGGNSLFHTITSIGGGGGGHGGSGSIGSDGGSGGGGGSSVEAGGSRVTSPVIHGFNGGSSNASAPLYSGGGGGGAGGVGAGGGAAGNGGVGLSSLITGSSVDRGGGGSSGSNAGTGSPTSASHGGSNSSADGTPNTGGGGGGASNTPSTRTTGRSGGSGVVILRYPSTRSVVIPSGSGLTTGQLNATVSGSTDKYTTFTGGTGTIQFS